MSADISMYDSREFKHEAGDAIEMRAKPDGSPLIVGYGAVFNRQSSIISEHGQQFIEKINPSAFTKTIKENRDVLALFNHDRNFILGRGSNGSLRLSQDDHGVEYEIDPTPTPWALGLIDQIRDGTVNGASFGFAALRDTWGVTKGPNGKPIDERTLDEVKLFDIGPVVMGAYPAATASLRSLLVANGVDPDSFDAFSAAVLKLSGLIERLESRLATESTITVSVPSRPTHPLQEEESTEPTPSGHSASSLARLYRLEQLVAADNHTRRTRSA